MSDLYAGSSYVPYQPAPFILGGLVAFDSGTLASGQDLERGTVIGRVAATGELVESEQDATNGSEIPVGVLNHDADATGGAMQVVYAKGGDLDKNQVKFHTSWSATQQLAAFDRTPIALVTPE
ncbi:head decoration protein [Marinobacter shengliensis]|uniref:head decoration protein n=1 Tax=Marinobacter shengliensis TaxID=1389223 RepID=UPI001108A39B|nr:head decoration protein [Marinobacter shengliensis]